MLTNNDILDIELLNRRGKVAPKHVTDMLFKIKELEEALKEAEKSYDRGYNDGRGDLEAYGSW